MEKYVVCSGNEFIGADEVDEETRDLLASFVGKCGIRIDVSDIDFTDEELETLRNLIDKASLDILDRDVDSDTAYKISEQMEMLVAHLYPSCELNYQQFQFLNAIVDNYVEFFNGMDEGKVTEQHLWLFKLLLEVKQKLLAVADFFEC